MLGYSGTPRFARTSRASGRAIRVAATVAGGALALSACGSDAGSGAVAAEVGEETITVGEVQTSTRELTKFLSAQAEAGGQQPQKLTPDALLASLVQVPLILDYAKANDVAVPSDATVLKQLEEIVPNPSRQTVDFFRANTAYQQMTPEQSQDIAQQVQKTDITFSPRYAALAGENPNWLKQTQEQAPFETP